MHESKHQEDDQDDNEHGEHAEQADAVESSMRVGFTGDSVG
jgi:hypothetical protein